MFTLLALAVVVPRMFNLTENGPDLRDPTAFIGCYGSGADKLILTSTRAAVVKTSQTTRITRYLYLKSNAAINTVNNLQYGADGEGLRIGGAVTGFFYRFDDSSKLSALLLTDDDGNLIRLTRVVC
jgi:hypothetical protein